MAKARESTKRNYDATRGMGSSRTLNPRLTAVGREIIDAARTTNMNWKALDMETELYDMAAGPRGDNQKVI